MKKKVAIAMSGGVDSGMAAKLLIEQGYTVTGIHMKLFNKDAGWESAKKTAQVLKIPFLVVDFQKIFKKRIIDYFLTEYAAGRTPNPCVMCNKFIKFGELLDYVQKEGFDYLATGHYARVASELGTDNLKLKTSILSPKLHVPSYKLLQAKDKSKDQSYFLYNLTQLQLSHILFPVGGYTKKEVRKMAKDWHLPAAERPESQEICFLDGGDYREFLKKYAAANLKPGEVVDVEGNIIGRHSGLPLYTIGQRHGFELRTKNLQHRTKEIIPPYYVIKKDARKNQLEVGFGEETERKDFWIKNINLIYDLRFKIDDLRVRVRSQGELLKCRIYKHANKQIKVILDESERGIASGQAAVFYKDDEVLGGGIIQ